MPGEQDLPVAAVCAATSSPAARAVWALAAGAKLTAGLGAAGQVVPDAAEDGKMIGAR